MRTFLRLKKGRPGKLPDEFRGQDLRYAEELVAAFLRRFTRPGDVVLDPFAGYGTTLIVAEAMRRVPFGVECEERRVEYIRSRLRQPGQVIHGDSRRLLSYRLPPFDFSITSPPFVERSDAANPLADEGAGGDIYADYLRDLGQIYAQARQLMKPHARVVLEVANLKGPAGITTLAWDVARALAGVLRFEGEIVVGWDSYDYGYDHSYCLVFSRPPD